MNNLSEEIIAKFLMGKCTEEELIQVNLWIKESDENARKLFRMEEIYHLGKEKHTVSPKRMNQAERSLYKRLAIEEAKQNRTLAIHRWMKYAAIITVILLTGTGITYWIGQNALINNKMIAVASEGNVEEIVLPDGTKVWLNQSAVLKYPREFSDKERNVYLEGEAYFEVTKNKAKPFIVQSEAMQVRVLGTTFNFKSSKACKSAEATLIEGEIEVKGNNEEDDQRLTMDFICKALFKEGEHEDWENEFLQRRLLSDGLIEFKRKEDLDLPEIIDLGIKYIQNEVIQENIQTRK